jgi:CRP-like cAMP-binding protein
MPIDPQILRRYVPLGDLTAANLQDLASKSAIETLPAGKAMFKRGDSDNRSFYLVSGEIRLVSLPGQPERLINANSQQARFPVEHLRPRQSTAIAKTEVKFFRIDNDLLDILLTWDQNAGYHVAEINQDSEGEDDDNDWMTRMLRLHIFHHIPPTNIQALFMRMTSVSFKANEVVIHQGDDGDYYYFIKSGRAIVTHQTKLGKVIKLAELEAGQGFGEESIISGTTRNATVTMITEGSLMRLAKKDFEELLKTPVLQKVDFAEAQRMFKQENAIFLDVRLESEHKNAHIPGSMNIPLYILRIKASTLDKNRTYITYCDTGRRSSSAAYLLTERGFHAVYLDGGLMALKKN